MAKTAGAKVTMKGSNKGTVENSGLAPASTTRSSFRKPYRSPCVKEHGTIREMTETVGYHGNWDGSHYHKNRTH